MKVSTIEITDGVTLIKAVEEANNTFEGQVWWRGQRCWSWSLLASAFRPGRGSNYERSANIRFRQRAPIRLPDTPDAEDFFAWLFLMQHHRLPTRLLDWTESPLIAAFFATEKGICNESEGKDYEEEGAALYALSPYALNETEIGDRGLLVPEDKRVVDSVKPAFLKNAPDEELVLALRPPEQFLRMMVQLSVFTIHAMGKLIEDLENSETLLIQYKVPPDSKSQLREELKKLGIRESDLFPDLDHLGEEVAGVSFVDPPKEKSSNFNLDLDLPPLSLTDDKWDTESST